MTVNDVLNEISAATAIAKKRISASEVLNEAYRLPET